MKPKKRKFNPEDTLEGQWCYDSNTGEEVLIDTKTNKEIMRRDRQINLKVSSYIEDCVWIFVVTLLIGVILFLGVFGK